MLLKTNVKISQVFLHILNGTVVTKSYCTRTHREETHVYGTSCQWLTL